MAFYRRLPGHLARLPGLLLDSYAPQLCLYCDQPSGRAEPLCEVCERSLILNRYACPLCALPDCSGAPCPACQQRPPPLRIVAPFSYERSLAYLMRRWKYEGDRRLVAAVALLARAPRTCTQPEATRSRSPVERVQRPGAMTSSLPDRGAVDHVALGRVATDPVPSGPLMPHSLPAALRQTGPETLALATPLHWHRRLQRGFNQSEDLLRAAGQRCPEVARARRRARHVRLRRRRATARQALAARSDRLRNLEGAFSVEGDVTGRTILLVDDVCTTGATGLAMAAAFKNAGAAAVTLWCLARTPAR